MNKHTFVPRSDGHLGCAYVVSSLGATYICDYYASDDIHDTAVVWTPAHLSTLRQSILTVIDDGDPEWGALWRMNGGVYYSVNGMTVTITDDDANDARLRFADAVAAIVKGNER